MSITYAQKNKNAVQTKRESSVSIIDSSSQSEFLQRKADMANNATQRAEAPRPNNTGMPDNLKAGIESLSGFSMDDVRVHYNSSKPATVQALAYTQGTDIHVAPGQEKHLPHEAWHVAQQMAGRVSPTTNINGMPVNDNGSLEHEADVMGEKAVTQRMKNNYNRTILRKKSYLKYFDTMQKIKIGTNRKTTLQTHEKLIIEKGKNVWRLRSKLCDKGVGKYVYEKGLNRNERTKIDSLSVEFGKIEYDFLIKCAPVVIKAFNDGLSWKSYDATFKILNEAEVVLNKIDEYRKEYLDLIKKVETDYRTYKQNIKSITAACSNPIKQYNQLLQVRGFNNPGEPKVTRTSAIIKNYLTQTTPNQIGIFTIQLSDSAAYAFHKTMDFYPTFIWHLL